MNNAPLQFEQTSSATYCAARRTYREQFALPPQAVEAPMAMPSGATSSMRPAQPWKCLPGLNAPLRMNAKSDVECMAVDGRNCLWRSTAQQCQDLIGNQPVDVKPLACGDMHKSVWGGSGYDNPNHWCVKGFNGLNG